MPEPGENEKEQEFISRCIPIVIDEGTAKDPKQASAICYSFWRKAHPEAEGPPKSLDLSGDGFVALGEPLKALGQEGNALKVGAYGIRFGNPEETDAVGDWFAPDTDYGPRQGNDVATMFNHGIPVHDKLKHLAKQTFGAVKTRADELGIFVEAVLDMADEYQATIARLVQAGKLRWSSGTASHLILRDNETGKLLRWHPVEFSYTPSAAEPRLPLIAPIKSLVGATYPDLEVEPEEAAVKAASVSTTAGGVTVNVTVNTGPSPEPDTATEKPITEVKNMDETTQTSPPAPVDVEAIVKGAVDTALKSYREKLDAEGPIKSPGIVVEDEAERALKARPYQTMGEFLMDVARAASHGIIAPRLLPLKSDDPTEENGFNVTKALGDRYVGSLTRAAHLKQLGLAEGIPSEGGYLVGTDRAGGILARVYQVGQLIQRVNMVGISANSNGMTFNAEDEISRVDGSRRGGIQAFWAAEAATKTASHPLFRQMDLKLRKVVGLCYATDELLADANALESWITNNFPEELRFVVEDAIINGTGAGQPAGIMGSGALVPVAAEAGQHAATIVSQNVMNMWARLWNTSRTNAIWLINQDCLPQIMQLSLPVGTGGVPLYVPPGGLSQAPYGTLLGRPVIESEYCATVGTTGDILLLDLSQYQMIEKGGIQSASSIHVQFITDQTVYRFVYRCDGQSLWNAPLTPHNGTNTVSPFVSLAVRA